MEIALNVLQKIIVCGVSSPFSSNKSATQLIYLRASFSFSMDTKLNLMFDLFGEASIIVGETRPHALIRLALSFNFNEAVNASIGL